MAWFSSGYNGGSYSTLVEPFATLQRLGVFDAVLPFILVFTIIFAVLQKTKILGERSKNFNGVIGLVMGMTVVVPHMLYGEIGNAANPYLSNGLPDVVNIMNRALPNVSVIIVAVLMVLLIFGIWGSKVRLGSNSLSGIIALFAFLSVIYIFGSAAGWWNLPEYAVFDGLRDPSTQALIITVLVFAIIIWFITKGDEHEEKKEDAFGKFFGSVLDTNKDDHKH
jgi:hypothetical protein